MDTREAEALPQHRSDDCPSHQPSKAQVQSEKASSHSCSHTEFVRVINNLSSGDNKLRGKDYTVSIIIVSTRYEY